jgi:hypothetical protein
MKILALEKELLGVADDDFTEEILQREARKAWQLYQSDVLRGLYFTPTSTRPSSSWNASTLRRLDGNWANGRWSVGGLIDFQVIPLVAYDGSARLFGTK